MSISKKLVVAGLAVAAFCFSSFADLEVTPYGAVQYRFREQINTKSDTSDNSQTTLDYSNRLGWRLGLKVKVDEQLSLQFQIGNDWSASEGVNLKANNFPQARVGEQNLYVHIASAKWTPDYLTLEAGVLPISGSGVYDLMEASLIIGSYREASWRGFAAQTNASMIGIRVGRTIYENDAVKIGGELFQSIIEAREQKMPDNLNDDPKSRPTAPLFVFSAPVEFGDLNLKVVPEVAGIINRNYDSATEKGDHEIIGGLNASYKISDELSVSLLGAYGTVSNAYSRVGKYAPTLPTESVNFSDTIGTVYTSEGLIFGAGASYKVGPGTINAEVKFNTSVDAENEKNSAMEYLYTDLRYGWKAHKNFEITPRWRTFTRFYPENNPNSSEFRNRFELMLTGSF